MPVLILLVSTTVVWAMLLVCNRIALTAFDVDVYAMTCWQLVFGGLALVLMAPGRLIITLTISGCLKPYSVGPDEPPLCCLPPSCLRGFFDFFEIAVHTILGESPSSL